MTERRTITAIGPNGPLTVSGQVARALEALIARGSAGVTALEMSSWALRLAHYIHVLRRKFGLAITIEREEHDSGWHGRYRMRSTVVIEEPMA
jgi:hypothetical protein